MNEKQLTDVEVTEEELRALQNSADSGEIEPLEEVQDTEITPEEAEALGINYSGEMKLSSDVDTALKQIKEEESAKRGPLGVAFDFLTESPGITTGITTALQKGAAEGYKAGKEAAFAPPELYPDWSDVVAAAGVPATQVDVSKVLASQSAPLALGKAAYEQATGKELKIPLDVQSGAAATSAMVLDPLNLVPAKAFFGVGGLLARPVIGAGKAFAEEGLKGVYKAGVRGVQDVVDLARAGLAPEQLVKRKKDIVKFGEDTRQAAIKATKEAVESFKQALNPPFADSANLDLDTARRIGLPPQYINSSTMFGPDALVTAVQKSQAQNRIGQELINHSEGIKHTSRALDQHLQQKLAATRAGRAEIPNESEAIGSALQETYKAGITNFFENTPIRYSTVVSRLDNADIPPNVADQLKQNVSFTVRDLKEKIQIAPPGKEGRLKNTLAQLEWVQKNLENPSKVPPSIAQKIAEQIRREFARLKEAGAVITPDLKEQLDYYDAIAYGLETAGKQQNLNHLIYQMQEIGKMAFSPEVYFGKEATPDIEILKRTYKQMQDAIFDAVKQKGSPEILAELKRANAETAALIKNNDILKTQILSEKATPSAILDFLMDKAHPERLRAYIAITGEMSEGPVRAAAAFRLEDILRKKPIALVENPQTISDLTRSQIYLFPSSKKALNENLDFLGQLKDAGVYDDQELIELFKIVNLGESFGFPILNPSGTFVSGQMANLENSVLPLPNKIVASGKNFAGIVANRVAGTRIINNAQKNAIEKALSGTPEELQKKWTQNSLEMLADIYSLRASENGGRLSIAEIQKDIMDREKQLALSSAREMIKYSPTELVTKSLIIAKRIHTGGTRVPILIEPQDRDEVARQILNDADFSNVQKARNIMHLKNTGFLLDLKPEEVMSPDKAKRYKMPSPTPGPTPSTKEITKDLMRKQIFKPSSKD